jgi:hypothetical protein
LVSLGKKTYYLCLNNALFFEKELRKVTNDFSDLELAEFELLSYVTEIIRNSKVLHNNRDL